MGTRARCSHSKFVKNREGRASSRLFASAVCPEQGVSEGGAVGLSKQLAEKMACQPLEDRCQQQVVESDRVGSKVDRIVSSKARRLPFCPHNGNPNYLAMEQEHKGCCIRAIRVKGMTHVLEQTRCYCLS